MVNGGKVSGINCGWGFDFGGHGIYLKARFGSVSIVRRKREITCKHGKTFGASKSGD
jgi:hypothetical protein